MFVFFGAVNTVLTYGIYLLLVLFIAYPAAYTVSYASGVFISYYLNARFVFKEMRRLLLENGFAIRWLTYWTTLLFPPAVLARTLGGSVTGRDFDSAANSLTPRLFRQIMALELSLLRRTSLPIGVALLAAARKSYGGIRSLAKTSLSK